MTMTRSRRTIGALTGAALLLGIALPASAHVEIIDGAAVVGGGWGTQVTIRVPHGCDGADTTSLEVQIPDGVTDVKPKWMAGWTIETDPRATAGASEAPDASMAPGGEEGAPASEVGVVRWTGGPLPDSQYLDFQISAVFPAEPGTVYLPAVQHCGDAQVAWIEIPAAGQDEESLDHPAPSVTIVEGTPAEE